MAKLNFIAESPMPKAPCVFTPYLQRLVTRLLPPPRADASPASKLQLVLAFFLPSRPASSNAAPALTAMENSLSGTFLIVDDDAGMRGLLETLIETAGATALAAASAPSAIALLQARADEITACLLDLNLDDCAGEDLYDDLRLISPSLPVFPMSGLFGDEIRERLGDRAVAGIIPKPFMSKQLIDTLRQGLAAQ